LFVLHQQKARSNVLVVFNLTSFKDFRVVFPDKADRSAVEHNSLYHVNILGQQTVNAILQFNPTEVRYIQLFWWLRIFCQINFSLIIISLFWSVTSLPQWTKNRKERKLKINSSLLWKRKWNKFFICESRWFCFRLQHMIFICQWV